MWPDRRNGPWLVSVTWAVIDGRIEAAGIEVRSARRTNDKHDTAWLQDLLPPNSLDDENRTDRQAVAVSSSLLRALPVAKVVEELRQRTLRTNEELFSKLGSEPFRPWRRPRSRGGPTLEDVADIYRESVKRHSRTPTADVANRLGIAHTTAAKRVQRARRAGLLPGTSPGRIAAGPIEEERQGA